jgi:presequence protease
MQSCNGLVTELGQLKEQLMGIDHLHYMRRLRKDKPSAEILKDIRQVADILFNQNTIRAAVNTSETDRSTALAEYNSFIGNSNFKGGNGSWYTSSHLSPSCRHIVMNIPVNYCAKALPTNLSYQNKEYAALKVMGKVLSAKYLLPVVREQNGAYGAGGKITSDGIFNFYSYRDPNSRKTLDTFDNAAEWVESNMDKINDEQVLFEAKLGVLQQLDLPIAPINQGMDQFRYGITKELFAKHRTDVLNVTSSDLKAVTEKFIKDENKLSAKCVLGSAKANVQGGPLERWVKSKEL